MINKSISEKKYGGSKTSKIKKNSMAKKNISLNNENNTEEETNINEIFNIIQNEIKKKNVIIKKENNTKNVISYLTEENIKKSPKSVIEQKKEPTAKKKNIKSNDKKTKEIPKEKSTIGKSDTNIDDKKLQTNKENDNINDVVANSYSRAKKFLTDHNISISTITLDCKLHTLIDVDIFAKNVILKEDEIVSVKFGDRKDTATNRTIVFIKTKKKPSKKNFYNQVTILMKPMNNPTRNYINIKVFKNGSLQMTGCKDMDDFNNVANTLINILKRGCNIKTKKGRITHVDFIKNPNEIGIFDVKIRMINSNFKLEYKVDRKKLARLLKKYHGQGTKDKDIGYVECKYEPSGGHSCVNIKYKYNDINKPSIFVFQTGAIIITGAKNLTQIIMAYHFIHKILNKYYDEIKIIDLDQKAVQAEIANFFKKNKNQSILLNEQ